MRAPTRARGNLNVKRVNCSKCTRVGILVQHERKRYCFKTSFMEKSSNGSLSKRVAQNDFISYEYKNNRKFPEAATGGFL